MRTLAFATIFIASAALAAPAAAFCGFYVAGADQDLFADATMVVMMREGHKTVLSMQNDYRGPVESFAMVVPVPVVLSENDVKTLDKEIFTRVDRLAAPRLVEYWEQDPCPAEGEGTIGLGNLGTIGFGGGGGSGYGRGAGARPLVRVEAEFAVGEYEIVILSADDSSALDTWLREHDYTIPDGAGAALAPYVQAGMKFFVAKVDVTKVTFEGGRAQLSPLRVQYETDEFSLPIRLGMLNSSGTQDLIVHVLARDQRYEAASYENVTIPTNLDVDDAVRESFGAFYAALFDQTLRTHENAVVTEYSWQATGCDPCPGPVLSARDLLTLGADYALDLPSVETSDDTGLPANSRRWRTQVRAGQATVGEGLSREVVRRIVRRHINELKFCHESFLQGTPAGQASVSATFRFQIGPDGRITSATVDGVSQPRLRACLETAPQRWAFPRPDGTSAVDVVYPMSFAPAPPGVPGRGNLGGSAPGPFQSFVLTRLHYRYGRGDLGDDLVFRPADAIEGGREWDGEPSELSTEARPASANNFQGRYVIRHAWEGDIACESPRRGVWGAPPAGLATDRDPSSPLAATNLGTQPRSNVALGTLLTKPLPAIGVTQVGPPPPVTPREPERDEAEEPGAAAATADDGCGCRSAPGAADGLGIFAMLALLGLRRRRLPR